jgi:MSHA pilin protein MshD
VNDYAGFAMGAGAVVDITGVPAVGGYVATIGVVPAAMGGIAAIDANGAAQALQITVTVTGPDGVPVVLDGYRTRYSPNGVP